MTLVCPSIDAQYSLNSNGFGLEPSPTFSDYEEREPRIKPIYRDRILPGLDKVINAFDKLKEYEDNWDGYGSLKPNQSAISRSQRLLLDLFQMTVFSCDRWITPGISADSSGSVLLEWWGNKNKKLSFYIDNSIDPIHFIQSSSSQISEMQEGKIAEINSNLYNKLFGWLLRE